MKILMTAIATAFVVVGGALAAAAGTELDKALGAGSFVHPTGSADGVSVAYEDAHQTGKRSHYGQGIEENIGNKFTPRCRRGGA